MKKKIQNFKEEVSFDTFNNLFDEDDFIHFRSYEEREETDEEYEQRLKGDKLRKKLKIEELERTLKKLKLEQANDI